MSGTDPKIQALLCDPQTSGGLLVCVEADAVDEVRALLKAADCYQNPIGQLDDFVANQPWIEVTA